MLGIAAVTNILYEHIYPGIIEKIFETEYYNLYDARDTGMHLLASAQLVDTTPRFMYRTGKIPLQADFRGYCGVYEAYFDEPVTVTDSFYVGCTANNNYTLYVKDDRGIRVAYRNWIQRCHMTIQSGYSPTPNHYRYRYHEIDSLFYFWPDDPWAVQIEDTMWHTTSGEDFILMFPIYDTADWNSYRPQLDTCDRPSGLSVLSSDHESTIITWDNNDSVVSWDVKVARDTATNGRITHHSQNWATLTQLDTASWYNISVRAICDSNDVDIVESPWSDTIMVYVPGDTSSHEPPAVGIASADDKMVSIKPNPAHSMVEVEASSTILTVEMFNTQGVKVIHHNCNANKAVINLDDIIAGLYTVRVKTNNGVVIKKLVVQ